MSATTPVLSPAREVLERATARMPAVTLDEVLATADLQTRVDRKYLVPEEDFRIMARALGGRLAALEIGPRRVFGYESVYFDTPELFTYRQHARGRRHRFKVRTRTYLDSELTAFEVKTEGGRGETIKARHPYPMSDRYEIDEQARALVADQIRDERLAGTLRRSLVTRYQRATLVDQVDHSRMTCDVDLTFGDDEIERHGPDRLVLVESKTAGGAAPADSILWQLGHRPVSLSKYCVGLALLHPHLPANRWNRTLRRGFSWSPQPLVHSAR